MQRFFAHLPRRSYSSTPFLQSEAVVASEPNNGSTSSLKKNSPQKKLTMADIRTSLRPALKPRGLRAMETTHEKNVDVMNPYDPVLIKKDFLYSKEGNFHPEYGFTNALEIASPIDIYKTYLIAQKNGQATLDKIPEKSFIDLLERCAKGHFGFLKGYTLFKFATQVRSDYLARGISSSPLIDSLVIECASFIPADSLDSVVRFVAASNPAASNDPTKIAIYNSLIKVFGASGRIEAAEKLYLKLALANLDLTLPSLALCKVYCQEGLMEKAEELFYGLEKNGIPISNKSSYLVALIRGWAKLGNIQQTRKYFNQFGLKDELHLRTIAFAALIQCYANCGLPGDAGFAYKDLRNQGLAASPSIFESMIRSFIPGKDITGANRWFQKILGAKLLRPSMGMFEALMRAQMAGGENLVAWKTFAKSLSAFKYIRSKSSRVHISFSMAEALVDNIRGKHIDYLRDHMRLAFVPVAHRGEVLAKLMYVSLNHSTAAPDSKLALTIYNEFHDKNGCANEAGITIMGHINAMRAYGMEGDVKSTQKIFDSIIDTSFDREVESYNVLIEAYVRAGDKESAQKYLSEFKSHGLEPTVSTFESMIALVQEDKEEVKRLAKEIDSNGCVISPKSHPLIAKALTENGFPFLPTLIFP